MLHTSTPKTATQLIARLRETEKIAVRAASPARLEWLRLNDFASDGPVSAETMAEVKRELDKRHTEFGKSEWWAAQTWNI